MDADGSKVLNVKINSMPSNYTPHKEKRNINTYPKASLNLSFDTETLKLISARNCFSISETSAVVNRDWRPPVVAEVKVDETESFAMGGVGQ